MDETKSLQSASAQNDETKGDLWQNEKTRINEKRRLGRQGIITLSSWHVSRLRAMEERSNDDYGTFIQFIKWKRGNVPEEDDDIEYLSKMTQEFGSLGGYAFFEKHGLDLPPIGIGGYEEID